MEAEKNWNPFLLYFQFFENVLCFFFVYNVFFLILMFFFLFLLLAIPPLPHARRSFCTFFFFEALNSVYIYIFYLFSIIITIYTRITCTYITGERTSNLNEWSKCSRACKKRKFLIRKKEMNTHATTIPSSIFDRIYVKFSLNRIFFIKSISPIKPGKYVRHDILEYVSVEYFVKKKHLHIRYF